MDLVECLGGVEGTLDVVPLMVGWGASVEMMGSVDFQLCCPYQLLLEWSHLSLV